MIHSRIIGNVQREEIKRTGRCGDVVAPWWVPRVFDIVVLVLFDLSLWHLSPNLTDLLDWASPTWKEEGMDVVA